MSGRIVDDASRYRAFMTLLVEIAIALVVVLLIFAVVRAIQNR